ncbi:hypothetical protein COHA_003622 [Chlorella ohadii]|uniref:Uncharacterized protein n=1 Tax=Chlorella ohadii TaxID=2649997 RepID=A0AAD5H3M1_9CHLO|nr:hypothetical protein COHA_003622 [Chlorella ohadii]
MRSARRAEGPLGPVQPPSPIARLLSQGGQEPTEGIEAAMQLASHRSGLQEPYFKTRAAQRGRPGDAAELLQLRRKAAAMSADFAKLLGTHERTEAAVVDLRQKVRQLREELGAKDKGLELARRTIERLSSKKAGLESAAAGTQAYVRKLEARLLSVRHAAELEQRCAQLKGQLERQELALVAAEERATAAEAALHKSQLDVACLKRGLELAAEQLTRSAGAEVPGTLLRAVARGQEEALGLSGQLSDARQQVSTLAAALEQARAHLEAQQTALAQQQAERLELVQRTEAAEAAADKQRAAAGELRRVLDALRPKAGALAGERDSLLQQLELERTAAEDARKEVKQLRAALKKGQTTEAALRDELRRALAGEGVTPSPAARGAPRGSGAAAAAAALAAQHTPRSARRAAPAAGSPRAGAVQSRSSSRAGSSSRLQHGLGAPAAAAPSPLKRAGSAREPDARAARADKAVSRQASAWEQQQQQWQEPEQDLISAEPSPTRALARLQEQRRQQQGSRLAVRERQQGGVEEAHGLLDLANSLQQPGQPPKVQLQLSGGATAAGAAKAVAAAEVLPVQDGRPMQLYSLALDEQIALLEGDLAQLSAAPSPIARLQKAAAAGAAGGRLLPAGAAPAVGKQGGTPMAQHADAPAPLAKQQGQQQPQEQQLGEGAIAAWRPNGAFVPEPAAEPAAAVAAPAQRPTRGMQQLMSPGYGTPGVASQAAGVALGADPVPHLWHSNPLAGSPPPKQLQLATLPAPPQQQQQQQQAHQPTDADAATTARPVSALHAEPGAEIWQELLGLQPSSPELGAAKAAEAATAANSMQPAEGAVSQHQAVETQSDDEWRWVGSGPASSPSLRVPRSQHGGSASESEVAGSQGSGTAQGQQARLQHPVLELQPQASEGSTGGGQGGVASLSQRWDLPSPLGAGNSHWLSAEVEADIECLEVNSRPTPRKPASQAAAAGMVGHEQQQALPPAPQQHGANSAPGSSSSAAAAQQGLEEPSASCWASGGWEASCGSSSDEEAELRQQPPTRSQQQRRAHPLLPGLPLVGDASPQQADAALDAAAAAAQPAGAALPLEPALVEAEQAALQQGQVHTLFDLAAWDMSELMTG